MGGSAFRARSSAAACWIAVALGAALPISVAADGVLLGLFVLAWLASGDFKAKGRVIRGNPAAISALIMFFVLALGTLWGPAAGREALDELSKYQDLLLIPMLVTLFTDERMRRYAVLAFAAGMLVTLAISYLIGLGLFPAGIFRGTADNPTVFRLHITQNFLMAYGAFVFACLARVEANKARRGILYALTFLALYNVIFMVQGRTGYLVAGVLLVYFFYEWIGARSFVISMVVLAALGAAAFAVSPSFQKRIDLAVTEYEQWRPDQPAETSIGYRLEFYYNTAALVRDHPLLGAGTGGFAKAYAARVQGTGRVLPSHPHSEFLLMAAHAGVLGLLAFAGMLLLHGIESRRIAPDLDRWLATGLVLSMAIGCLFNTLLRDHTEGLFYCWLAGILFAAYRRPSASGAATPSHLESRP